MGRGEGRGAAKGGGKGWGKGWGKAMGWGKGSGKGKGEAKGGADGPAKDQNVLAADDFGRAYTDEEKVSFATLIMYQELTNVEYGHFKNLRAWPGIVGSALLELQRAARRQNPPNDMVMHKVFHIGEDVTAHMTKKQLKNIHDDATEARLCELASATRPGVRDRFTSGRLKVRAAAPGDRSRAPPRPPRLPGGSCSPNHDASS
jgi:hypothetical protein